MLAPDHGFLLCFETVHTYTLQGNMSYVAPTFCISRTATKPVNAQDKCLQFANIRPLLPITLGGFFTLVIMKKPPPVKRHRPPFSQLSGPVPSACMVLIWRHKVLSKHFIDSIPDLRLCTGWKFRRKVAKRLPFTIGREWIQLFQRRTCFCVELFVLPLRRYTIRTATVMGRHRWTWWLQSQWPDWNHLLWNPQTLSRMRMSLLTTRDVPATCHTNLLNGLLLACMGADLPQLGTLATLGWEGMISE